MMFAKSMNYSCLQKCFLGVLTTIIFTVILILLGEVGTHISVALKYYDSFLFKTIFKLKNSFQINILETWFWIWLES